MKFPIEIRTVFSGAIQDKIEKLLSGQECYTPFT